MSELADLWSGRPERERRKASGTAEFPREVPDRVIDAPIPDDLKPLCSRFVAPREAGKERINAAEFWSLIERIARLEAEKQDALEIANEMRTGTRNHPAICSPSGDFKCDLCRRLAVLSKPTAAKQGDAS